MGAVYRAVCEDDFRMEVGWPNPEPECSVQQYYTQEAGPRVSGIGVNGHFHIPGRPAGGITFPLIPNPLFNAPVLHARESTANYESPQSDRYDEYGTENSNNYSFCTG
jgi:hypothetical protein